MPNELNAEEKAAIAALKRLAKKWPATLLVFAKVGTPSLTLSIRKPNEAGKFSLDTEVDWVVGINSVGGIDPEIDPGDAGVTADLIPPVPPIEPSAT